MHFNVTTSRSPSGGTVIAIAGEFALANVEPVEVEAEAAIAEEGPLIFDLSQCTFIDSSALRLILQIQRSVENAGPAPVPIAVVAGDSPVRKMFSVTAIDQSIPVVRTLEEAEASIRVR
jgi:anti-anti-sigma factor